MAAIGKIRSWGPWLVGIIGLALFGFIATDFTRSCETSSNQARQQVGEVMGTKMSIQDYQANVEEYKNVFKQIGQDVEEDQLREFVWNNYVQNSIIEEEAAKLGIGVTEQEMKDILATGTHPILQMGNLPLIPMFYNQQTGAFDFNNVTQIYAYLQQQSPEQYNEFDRYWKTVEKLMRQQLLQSKYMTLLQACMLSNGASAKMAFDGSSQESQIELASLLFSTINDNDVTIADKDLKAMYDQKKEMFKWENETRDVKYVVCNVKPSDTDINTLREGLQEAAKELRADSMAVADILASHRSTLAYHEAMPYNVAGLNRISPTLKAALDTLAEKQVTAPFNYSSVQSGKMIDQTVEDAVKTADSLVAVLKGGVPFDTVAVSMGQSATKAWFSANTYQNEESVSADNKALFTALHEAGMNEPRHLTLSDHVRLYVVTERKQPVTLYDVAIVSNEVRFSNDTYENAFNQFSQYLSECSTAADLDKNAGKYSFQVMDQQNLRNNANAIGANAPLQNTREAVKWVFNQASEGSISEIYQNSADGRFVAVAVTKVHPVGYLDQQSVEEYLRGEVLKEKKAEKLIQQLAGAKTVAEAVAKGAVLDTISRITFPTTVSVKGQRERGLSGAVAATAVGQTVKQPVKGTNGVFLFSVINREAKEGATFDAKQQENSLMRNAAMSLLPSQYSPYTNVLDVLRSKAKVKDNRYQF